MNAGREKYRETLEQFLKFADALARIPVKADKSRPEMPHWDNGWLPGLDIVALYSMIALKKPQRFIEIGSGNSTKVARMAIADQALTAKIISIDPKPRAEIDRLCDRVIRKRLENSDLRLFDDLEPDDILFMDGSHRTLMNSDATVFFLEILPRLKPGVIVQIHDIHLPNDYPHEWRGRYYSEQYLLGIHLLTGRERVKTIMPNAFVTDDEELGAVLKPLWERPELAGAARHGGSFWFES